ncbi:MAG TPA: tetratricopeptide repeat protein [Polyangiaceae bacterium]|nr:tetratricopeptide repeat protein [Polyangiaceae bacterium]
MAENSDDLERLSREQLILKARVLGVERPELMTRVEMRDEIVRRSEPDLAQQKRARGFLGVARDLVASVVEAGLNLPDAAALIRGDNNRENHWKGPPPVATVTLAEIYAAQGHLERALRMLDEVLAKEPDHDPARALRTRLATATDLPVAPPRRRQKISFAEPAVSANAPDLEQTDNGETQPQVESASAASAAPEPEPAVATSIAFDFEPAAVTETAPTLEPESLTANAFESEAPPVAALAVEPTPADVIVNEPAPASSPLAAEPAPAPEPEPTPAPEPAPAPAPLSLLTLALAGQRQIYWELPPESLSALRAHSPGGRPLLRVIAFRTRAGSVERQASDISPDTEVGFAVLPNLRADAVVRAVLGWEAEGRFMPYLVASDVPSGSPSSRQSGPFRANPLVGPVSHEVELRALGHCSGRPAH